MFWEGGGGEGATIRPHTFCDFTSLKNLHGILWFATCIKLMPNHTNHKFPHNGNLGIPSEAMSRYQYVLSIGPTDRSKSESVHLLHIPRDFMLPVNCKYRVLTKNGVVR